MFTQLSSNLKKLTNYKHRDFDMHETDILHTMLLGLEEVTAQIRCKEEWTEVLRHSHHWE